MLLHVNAIYRSTKYNVNGDYMSREGGDFWYNPLINTHNIFVATLCNNFLVPVGPIRREHIL